MRKPSASTWSSCQVGLSMECITVSWTTACFSGGSQTPPPSVGSGWQQPCHKGAMPGALTGIVPRRLLVAVLLLGGVVIAGAGVTVVLLPHGDAGSPSSVSDHGSAVTFGGRAGFDVSVSDVHVPDTAG